MTKLVVRSTPIPKELAVECPAKQGYGTTNGSLFAANLFNGGNLDVCRQRLHDILSLPVAKDETIYCKQ